MELNPRKYSHFNGIHLGDTSTFSSAFPINPDIKEVDEVMNRLPQLVDTGLAVHGAAESFETSAKSGAIPLQPTKTGVAINKVEDQEARRLVRGRHFVFRSITEGADLHTAHLSLDRERSAVEGLSLFCHGFQGSQPIDIELRAVLNSPHEDIYEIVTYKPGEDSNDFLVDADVANAFIHALRENQAGHELPSLSKEAGLLELLEKSKHYSHTELGSYDINGEANRSLRIEREQKITRGVARTSFLKVELEETSFTDEIETIRQFGLQIRGKQHTAWLNYLIRSLNGDTPAEERASMFEDISVHLRNEPAILFSAIEQSAQQFASLE